MIINTFRSPWLKGRTDGWVTANDTDLAVATKSWHLRPTAKIVDLPIGTNAVVIAFIGGSTDAGDPDGDTFTSRVYLYSERGPAEMVYDVDCTVGKMQVLTLPTTGAELTANGGKYVDTMTSGYANNSTQWLTEVGFADYEGQDGLSVMAFDALGASAIYPVILSLTANLKVYPIIKVY